ncbi:MAG: peptidoglycan editing factor PgeF [Syntrophales bacterium]|nr:peptidoglycan editing factor PgeF [Syntrophales bacterium]
MPENPDHRYGTECAFSFSRLGGVRYLESQALGECGFITHAFCTRWGGVSEGRLADLNFGVHVGDSEEHLARNRELLCAAFDMSEHTLVTVDQVHGDRLLVIDETFQEGGYNSPLECDGIITAIPGVPIGIKTADCVPVLLADLKRRVVGAVHAGWKGTVLGIAARAAGVFMETFSSAPEDILAVIGPAIGPCCYEVDEAVFHRFDNREGKVAFTGGRKEGKWMLDLAAANRSQLQGVGIPRGNIFSADICTSCRHDTFFSHRGEGGDTGRQLNFIMLR